MLWHLIEKELKSIIQSPKFGATFGVCSILLLLSFFSGIQEYQATVAQYDSAMQAVNQQLGEVGHPWDLDHSVYRSPSPMHIFVSGVSYDIGRTSNITKRRDSRIEQSPFSDDPVFAVFRFLDFAFIVHVVLSLLAIVFTYDAINGERERGTLKLVLSNSIPRGHYLFSKLVGSWLGLTIPILLSMLLGVLLLLLYRIPLQNLHWIKLLSLFGVSILYFSFFITIGLLVSSHTRRSSDSFLILLVFWVSIVLIIPRAATMAVEQFVEVPSVEDHQSQKDRYKMDWWFTNQVFYEKRWEQSQTLISSMTQQEQEEYWINNSARYDAERDSVQAHSDFMIANFNRQLNENRRNMQSEQERLTFIFSRFSPASSFKLVAMNLCSTNASMKTRFGERVNQYRNTFLAHEASEQKMFQAKQRQQQQAGIEEEIPYDSSGMPRFQSPSEPISAVLQASMVDFGILAIYTVLVFAGAFLAFLRYDVR